MDGCGVVDLEDDTRGARTCFSLSSQCVAHRTGEELSLGGFAGVVFRVLRRIQRLVDVDDLKAVTLRIEIRPKVVTHKHVVGVIEDVVGGPREELPVQLQVRSKRYEHVALLRVPWECIRGRRHVPSGKPATFDKRSARYGAGSTAGAARCEMGEGFFYTAGVVAQLETPRKVAGETVQTTN